MNNAREIQELIARLPIEQTRLKHERILSSNERKGRALLHDPIAFAEEAAIDRNGGPLEELFISYVKPVQETLDLWMSALSIIAQHESQEQMIHALGHFEDFITNIWMEGVEKGLALGVVTEQYRSGLVEVLKRNDREFSYGDGVYLSYLAEVCDKTRVTFNTKTTSNPVEASAD